MSSERTTAGTLGIGLTTSIGTLPHDDPAAAVAFVLDHQYGLPAVPQLPNRSPLERRLPQATWGIDGISVRPDASITVDHKRLDADAPFTDPGFLGAPYVTLHAFLEAVGDRVGPAKFQLTGPLTVGVALHAAGVGATAAFAIAHTVVRSRAQALVQCVAQHAPGVMPVVFVDEPALRDCMDPAFPIRPEEAVDLVSSTLATLEPHAVTGLRCTRGTRRPDVGATPVDWPLVLQTGPQILAVPVDDRDRILASVQAIDGFLERGGFVAWGAVPTEGPVGSTVSLLWRTLSALWCDLVQAGCDVAKLRTQALITPAGGLGRHTVEQAVGVYHLVDELARRLYDQATGIRLSVGA